MLWISLTFAASLGLAGYAMGWLMASNNLSRRQKWRWDLHWLLFVVGLLGLVATLVLKLAGS